MQLTRQAEYALKTLLELASHPFGEILSSKVISERQDISEDFLKKTIQLLSLSGLVVTQRGNQGGVRLAKPADQITIADVVTAIEGPIAINPCLAPGYSCPNRATCQISPILSRAQQALLAELSRESLADLAGK
ncbi:Transcription regulator Rrf2-like [Syntrophomonas zehnderi OL-4]|uniref:Transcription regulator Rrf2-like n=1 Tax=Syntrophomonas zehnderi OL-4 TaxID=690567 RepID=A0A0E4C8G4_9FIRM|nr:Rrf2 family transcriptional regulator [Syntrophomonas zehnderi]CFX48301.1 Transcription regulator Rrf2-like [Syntrophomonas zehnderi OL-4]